jgi:hypothetical protein
MSRRKVTPEQVRRAVLEAGSLKGAAERLGVHRKTAQRQIDNANSRDGVMAPRAEANPSRWRPGAEIVQARKAEFERVKGARPERGTLIHLADDKPFCLVALGDPHLDNPGTDLELWERWIGVLDYRKHVHGFPLGDWLDNWPRVLSFLYATAETTAPEAWILLEYYLEQIGEHLIASVAGNHDDWSGFSDVLGGLMRKHGVIHRSKSLRAILRAPGCQDVTIHARHRWMGRSMYNEVHALKRAAMMGERHDILLGGDLHISGDAIHKDAQSGMMIHCHQVASFKLIDDYADDKGFRDAHISPAVALVIDPRKPPTNPERVKHFYEPEPAVAYLNMLRKAKAA